MSDAGDEGLAAHVGRVLRRVWDPIGLGARGPEDEYDAYVPDLVALTRDTAVFEDALLAHLARIEVEAMHLTLPPAKRTRAARALLGLREAGQGKPDRLVEQWSSLDGLRCAWVFETPGGLHASTRRASSGTRTTKTACGHGGTAPAWVRPGCSTRPRPPGGRRAP